MSRIDRILDSLTESPWQAAPEAGSEVLWKASASGDMVEVELGDIGTLRMYPEGAEALAASLLNAAKEAKP